MSVGIASMETRLLIPSKMGGAVIGKKGCNIQQLRSDYNATIRYYADAPSLSEGGVIKHNLSGFQTPQGQSGSCP